MFNVILVFTRSIPLLQNVKLDKISAKFSRDGLEVILSKADQLKRLPLTRIVKCFVFGFFFLSENSLTKKKLIFLI